MSLVYVVLESLVTPIVYVRIVVTFWAVTWIAMLLLPTLRLIGIDAEPLVIPLPLTVMLAWFSPAVGRTVTEVTLLSTLSV
jgi:hypothetical protein